MKLATLCYLRNEGHTLMMHRIKKENDMHRGKWNGLGGKLLPGETPEECAVREIREECGLNAEEMQWKGLITFPRFNAGEDWYTHLFVVSRFSGNQIESDEGLLQWIPNEALLQLHLWEGDRIFLPWLDRPGFFSAKFVYENKRLVDYKVQFYR